MHLSDKGLLFHVIPEINPPVLQDSKEIHKELNGLWTEILITDNPMGVIRVSPYAFASRCTHDVPSLIPTVVTSTRDRNLLAVDSEIRGAVMNGVHSFLVVSGDILPSVDHYSTANEVVRHLKDVQDNLSISFEIGMTSRFSNFSVKRRIEMGAQFFVVGPVLSPNAVFFSRTMLDPSNFEVPLYLGVIPPFSYEWVDKMRHRGGLLEEDPTEFLANLPNFLNQNPEVWEMTQQIIDNAKTVGYSGVVLMGMKMSTVIEASRHLL